MMILDLGIGTSEIFIEDIIETDSTRFSVNNKVKMEIIGTSFLKFRF